MTNEASEQTEQIHDVIIVGSGPAGVHGGAVRGARGAEPAGV